MTTPSPTARIDEWNAKLKAKYGSLAKAAAAASVGENTLRDIIQRGHAATDRQFQALSGAGITVTLKRSEHWRRTMHAHFR